MDMRGRYLSNNNNIIYYNNYPYNTSFSSTTNNYNYQNNDTNNYAVTSLKKSIRNNHQAQPSSYNNNYNYNSNNIINNNNSNDSSFNSKNSNIIYQKNTFQNKSYYNFPTNDLLNFDTNSLCSNNCFESNSLNSFSVQDLNTKYNKKIFSSSQITKNDKENKENLNIIYKKRIENAKPYEEIILPEIDLEMQSLQITKPIIIKGNENSTLIIKEGPININLDSFSNNSKNNIVKICQLRIIYYDTKSQSNKKITTLFKLYPRSLLQMEDCDLVYKIKNESHVMVPNFAGGKSNKKSVAFLLLSNKKNTNYSLLPTTLNIKNTRISNFYQSIRSGLNCVINVNKSAFMQNYGKAIVMINPINIKINESFFQYNCDNVIHAKFIDDCLYNEQRQIYIYNNEFDSALGNDICIEGIKNLQLNLNLIINKNNFCNNSNDGVLIFDLFYNNFEIINNTFTKNKSNGLNIQKTFYSPNKKFNPIKIKNNQFIENKGFGLFINDCLVEVNSNKFTINRQSGMCLCNLNIDDTKKNIDGNNQFSNINTGNIYKKYSFIFNNSFTENGENGLYINNYPYLVEIQESVFSSNCKNGITVNFDNSINNFISKFHEFKNCNILKCYELANIILKKCVIEKNLKNGIEMNGCLIYSEESFIMDNIDYAISITKKEYQFCFRENTSDSKKNVINGRYGGEWGEIKKEKGILCGLSCISNGKEDYKKKVYLENKVHSYIDNRDQNNIINNNKNVTDNSNKYLNEEMEIEDKGGCTII